MLVTQGTNHRYVSVIFITQNSNPRGKHARTLALNTWYNVLTTARDVGLTACILEHQLHSGKVKGFIKAYEYDFSASHWYLIPDTCPNGDDDTV